MANWQINYIVSEYLRENGFKVTDCELQSEAEERMARGERFDLILLDGWTDVVKTIMTTAMPDNPEADSDRFLAQNMNEGMLVIMISANRALGMRSAKHPDVKAVFDKSKIDESPRGGVASAA